MSANDYTAEQHAWLTEHYPHMSNRELADAWPWADERPMTRKIANSYARNHHLHKLDRGRGNRKYTDEQLDWLRAYIPGHEEREIIDAYAREFGETLSVPMVANLKVKLGVKSGTSGGRFHKGNVPVNKGRPWSEWMPEGSREGCRRTQFKEGTCTGAALEKRRDLLDMREQDGYLQIKVAPRKRRSKTNFMGNWIPYAQFVWMQHNGRDWPDDCRAVFADRNPRNFSPDNIVPVPMDVYAIVTGGMHGHAVPWHDRETLEVAIAHARLHCKAHEIELTAPRRCGVCGKVFVPTAKQRSYPKPVKTCPECRAQGRRTSRWKTQPDYRKEEMDR